MKEQLILFLGAIPGLLAINDFLRTADHDQAALREGAVSPLPPGVSSDGPVFDSQAWHFLNVGDVPGEHPGAKGQDNGCYSKIHGSDTNT